MSNLRDVTLSKAVSFLKKIGLENVGLANFDWLLRILILEKYTAKKRNFSNCNLPNFKKQNQFSITDYIWLLSDIHNADCCQKK